MANPFTPKLFISDGADNASVDFFDTSNYGDNDDNITNADIASRAVSVIDKDNIVIAVITLTLQNGKYTGHYPLDKDRYYQYRLQLIKQDDTILFGYTNYVSVCFYNTKFLNVMQNKKGDCGCNSGNICTDLTWSMHNKNAAIIFADKGMGILAQESIDDANTFINSLTTLPAVTDTIPK